MMFGRGYNGVGFGNCFGNGFGFGAGPGFMYNGWGMIMMAAFIIIGIAAVVYIVKVGGRRQSTSQALETLKMRLAQGEISEEEYIRRRNVLNQ